MATQRYHMAGLHPSVLGASMAAAGLRDESDCDDDEPGWDSEEEPEPEDAAPRERRAAAADGGGGGGGCLSAERVEALFGSLPTLAGHPLQLPPAHSPGSCGSSHSNALHHAAAAAQLFGGLRTTW